MLKLEKSEVTCLKEIKRASSSITTPCSQDTLDRLLRLGLIEYKPDLWAPLECIQLVYQLTPLGHDVLDREN